jgi:hypothetical protein
MPEDDKHSDDIQAHLFAGPFWDEEEEPSELDDEPVADDADDDVVEAHASGGFN